jgi:RNA-directed DNA polymerase
MSHRFCRYADDCNIYVRSHRAGERVMASVSRFLTTKLRLRVNETKSAVARPEERKFLGFSISNDGGERRIAPKALDVFKTRIREQTCRTRGLSLSQITAELTPYLIWWRSYFGFCQTPRVLTNLEAWIRRRLRSYLWRQWGNGHSRFKELRQPWRNRVQSSGRRRFADGVLAYVRTPDGPSGPTQPLLRCPRSPPTLCSDPSITRSNRRGT